MFELDLQAGLKCVACKRAEVRFPDPMRKRRQPRILSSLNVLTANTARIQTIQCDRRATVQTACQLCESEAFSDWVCLGKCVSIWMWHTLDFYFLIKMLEFISHNTGGVFLFFFYPSLILPALVKNDFHFNVIKTCTYVMKTCRLSRLSLSGEMFCYPASPVGVSCTGMNNKSRI